MQCLLYMYYGGPERPFFKLRPERIPFLQYHPWFCCHYSLKRMCQSLFGNARVIIQRRHVTVRFILLICSNHCVLSRYSAVISSTGVNPEVRESLRQHAIFPPPGTDAWAWPWNKRQTCGMAFWTTVLERDYNIYARYGNAEHVYTTRYKSWAAISLEPTMLRGSNRGSVV